MISLIVAYCRNRIIGAQGVMPWRGQLPADLKRFKQLTSSHIIVMGRITFESLGKPLPNRIHVVLTSGNNVSPQEDVVVVPSVDRALFLLDEARKLGEMEVFVIGGEKIYRQFLPLVDRLYLTEINAEFSGDAFFPEIVSSEWKEIKREEFKKNDRNIFDHTFLVLQRVRPS